MLQWAAASRQHYSGVRNERALAVAGQVLVAQPTTPIGASSACPAEEHIPFAVSENMDWLGTRTFDLVIALPMGARGTAAICRAGWPPADCRLASARFPIARVITTTPDVKGYIRVRNHNLFPSLADTDLLLPKRTVHRPRRR